jgi:hypothetical protein
MSKIESEEFTCDGCAYHQREGNHEHRDYCSESSGERVLRQSSTDYWPKYPPACSCWRSSKPMSFTERIEETP